MIRRPVPLLLVVAGVAGTLMGVLAPSALADTQTASSLFAQLATATANPSGYDRSEFGNGWTDADDDGCDTRSEVLQAESAVPVTSSSGCTVATGQWTSPYDGATWTNASDVDIDHMVPLGEAWASGASTWTADQRLAYANDLDFPDHLIAVTDNVNQSKGDRDPAQWLPPLTSDRCTYAVDWVAIKWAWSLTVDTAERSTLTDLLAGGCGQTQVTIDRVVAPVTTAPSDRLEAGQTLAAGQTLRSDHGDQLAMQTDGNLVLYGPDGAVLFQTGTRSTDARLVMQTDGNLVVYAGDRALWANGARGSDAAVVVQSDGNVVEYVAGRPVWQTVTTSLVTDTLTVGGQLSSGQRLVSADGSQQLVVQSDGNVVLYRGDGSARWSTGTAGHPGAVLRAQTDGNVVVYGPAALWQSGTAGRGGQRLVMQSDGNLVLYSGSNAALFVAPPPAPPAPVVTDTLTAGGRLDANGQLVAANGAYRFTMQSDGNAVLYGPAGARWSTGTGGHPGAYLLFQSDGNAVVYGPGPLWQSGTAGRGGQRLVMQTDGNLVLYSSGNAPLFVAPPAAPPTGPPPPSVPPKPADADCGDFSSQAAAQAFFNYYFQYYGDFSGLDGDNDGVACESYDY